MKSNFKLLSLFSIASSLLVSCGSPTKTNFNNFKNVQIQKD